MAKKKTAARARKPGPAKSQWVLSTQTDYREALIVLMQRQYECARAGLIGTRAWELAYREDIFRINAYRIYAGIGTDALPHLYPTEGSRLAQWIVIEPELMPSPTDTPPTWQFHVIPAEDPDAIEAVNLIGTHTLARWLALAKVNSDGNRRARSFSNEVRPYAWFDPVGITGDNLRKWFELGTVTAKKHNGKNFYNVSEAFHASGKSPHIAYEICESAERERMVK